MSLLDQPLDKQKALILGQPPDEEHGAKLSQGELQVDNLSPEALSATAGDASSAADKSLSRSDKAISPSSNSQNSPSISTGGTDACMSGNARGEDSQVQNEATHEKDYDSKMNKEDDGNGEGERLNITGEMYSDPTPRTPRQGVSPTREDHRSTENGEDDGSTSEIQSIMDQFDLNDPARAKEEECSEQVESPNLELGQFDHPPRRSSLEPPRPTASQLASETRESYHPDKSQPTIETGDSTSELRHPGFVPPSRVSSLPQITRLTSDDEKDPSSPQSPMQLPKILPAPDPEPDLPFDFHRFLEQLRHRTADPVAKYLRSFLIEFGRKQWMVHEQVKLIGDFLSFITNKMARCEIWRGVNDAEFDNAKEGMEKLVMNRLYTQTFSPAVPPPTPSTLSKGKRKTVERPGEPGRRGQHQEDIERDEVLGQKVSIYGWVQEEHLDIPPVGQSGRKFLVLAQQELLKIKTYRAPRDKIICVLNCCKVIFGILRNTKSSDTSADSFVPLLIYVVLHANPEHLVSNVQYILRFRNPDKLNGEAGYYLSSLMGAIQFIENLDRTSLTIPDEDFEKNVELAVSAIAEKHQEEPRPPRMHSPRPLSGPHLSEKSALSQPEVVPRNSIEAEYSSPWRNTSSKGPPTNGPAKFEEGAAVSGLLKTIQKPLTSIGRIFSEEPGTQSNPQPPRPPQRLSPAVFQPPRSSNEINVAHRQGDQLLPSQELTANQKRRVSAEDAAASQASAEAAEAQRIQRAEHQNIVESVWQTWPA